MVTPGVCQTTLFGLGRQVAAPGRSLLSELYNSGMILKTL